MKNNNNSGFLFVFLTVALDMLSIGIIIPIMPNLIKEMTGGNISHAALVMGWFSMGWATAQFFFMPIIGGLSDHFGRKPIFLLSNFGQALAYLLTAIAPNLWFLLLARITAGIMSGSVSTAYAFIADTEEPKNRAAKFGLLGAAFGMGFVLGPALGGWLGSYDLRLPMWFAAIISTCTGIYGIFFLRESHKIENRTKFTLSRANPINTLFFFNKNRDILGLAIIKYLNDFAHVVLPSTFVLYAAYRFGWGPKNAGLLMTFVGICGVIVQGGLIKRIISWLGEKKGLYFGLLFGSIGFFIYGIADTPLFVAIAVPISALWGVYGASIQSYLTSKISPTEQGRLQGALGSMTATSSIIGPVVFTHIFAYFISDEAPVLIPGAAMIIASILILISLILALKITKNEPDRVVHQENEQST